MDNSQDVLRLLKTYTRKIGNPRINYPKFAEFAVRYFEKHALENPEYNEFASQVQQLLPGILEDLETEHCCSLTREGEQIAAIIYSQFYVDSVRAVYARMEKLPDMPFPSEDTLTLELPADIVVPVDVKLDFVSWISRNDSDQPVLLRLLFPEGIHSVIVPSDLVKKKLVDFSVQKIRTYLRTARNASYMHQKLLSLFRQRDLSLRDAINSILATPDQATSTVYEPNDFFFQFWTQLSTNVIREFAPKVDKLAEEHGYAQAAYLLGYYNVYFRGMQQKNLERESALKQFEAKLKKKPYAFSIGDMYNFADSKGVLLTKKYPVEAMHEVLTRKTTPPNETSLPEIIRVRTAQKKEFYIGKEFVLPVFAERLFLMSRTLKDYYSEAWSESLKRDEIPKAMTEEAAFEENILAELTDRDPLLHSLMNYNLLFLCAKEIGLNGDAAAEVSRFFDRKEARLRPYAELLGLDRQKLRQDAFLMLPFWQAIPLFRAIVRFFQRVLLGRPAPAKQHSGKNDAAPVSAAAKEPYPAQTAKKLAGPGDDTRGMKTVAPSGAASGAQRAPMSAAERAEALKTRKAQAAAFRAAVQKLEQSFIPAGQTRESTMKQLIDRWNPILEPTAKQNLIEDVNSLVRDYLRRVRSGFRFKAPDAARIHNMARELCEHEALKKIKKSDQLKQYVELYMLMLLGK
ncbi:MAG TPA: hypothetical protein VMW73_08425 [Spirochaetia bacterium]|nr:hypothetical protein [Spirochaetia bacterium]